MPTSAVAPVSAHGDVAKLNIDRRARHSVHGSDQEQTLFDVTGSRQYSLMTDLSDVVDPSSIVVLPELPGTLSSPADDRPTYPSSTLAFVKILRNAGYPVRLATPEDVREVSHHSVEVWLPVAAFGLQVLAGGAGNVLADILLRLISSTPRSRGTVAHIRWNVQAPDGATHEFKFDGDGVTAVEAARAFERSLGYGSDEH